MNKLIARILLRIALYISILVVIISLPPFLIFVFPPHQVTNFSPASYDLAYQDITLHTKDGMTLTGWFVPNKNSKKAIVVCHGYPKDKGDILLTTSFLARDFNLLYFDFRAMGESSGKVSTFGWRERTDVLAAVEFLKKKGFDEIGAFGFSMGAATVLMTNNPDIKCIVSDSSYAALDDILPSIFLRPGVLPNFIPAMSRIYARIFAGINISDMSPMKYISGMRIPILLIHCAQDITIPISEAQRLHDANPKTKLWIIPDGGHGHSFDADGYGRTVVEFFNIHL